MKRTKLYLQELKWVKNTIFYYQLPVERKDF
jgi:hypothetical protein